MVFDISFEQSRALPEWKQRDLMKPMRHLAEQTDNAVGIRVEELNGLPAERLRTLIELSAQLNVSNETCAHHSIAKLSPAKE